jgi:cellulose synthase/poly-beta-1,6-N-acetylglucosamine synthase-like glycosyltransferase
MSEPKISVIIPVRNEADKIEQCLKAVFAQSLKPYEVIVVDGHSHDGTVERAGKFPIKILFEDYHTRGGACQVGVENAEGEYVAFTDADCIPDKDWLVNLVKEFDSGIIGVGGAIKNIGEGFWIRSINLACDTFLGSANSVQGRFFKHKRFVNSISGCNSMYRRQDILKVGGFNTNLPGAEDAELNGRLLKGGKLLYLPIAVILHDHGRGVKEFAKQMFRYGRDRGVARRLALQVAPPLSAPLLLLSLIFTPWIFLSLLASYLVILVVMGLKFAVREKNIKYLISIPSVYVIEHSLYTLGFWKGLTRRK